ncbi:hypothetical protein LAZ67_3004805 [Cordylochernes scorpioides]|uniref:Transposase n=1 Tax=Cordylochernes scorpioides TaxID=51811 RepID=A0ABY6KCX1_9ARAC|nr:hypothetical protein LAZ67_3004805 [Cordylochernes scorpioides]
MQRMTEAPVVNGAFVWMLLLLALQLDDPVDHLKDAMRGLAVPRTEQVIIAPIDNSCATNIFLHRFEQTDKRNSSRNPGIAPPTSIDDVPWQPPQKGSQGLIASNSTRPIQDIIHLTTSKRPSLAKTLHFNLRSQVSVYGEECMSIQMVRRWRSWFLEGWQNVHDDERSGSPVTATDNAAVSVVQNVVEADRRVTIDEIIIRLPPGIEIRRSSIGTIMSDVLDFRKVCARWVARLLLENHKQQRMEAARVFLEMHQRDGDQLFSRIVTGDESWVHHSTPETKRRSMVWKKPEESVPKKAKVTISAGKVMAMENFKWEIFTHPPHSPELAPSDFHLYPALKWHLGGKHFANDDEVQAEANHWLLRQDTAWYNSGI